MISWKRTDLAEWQDGAATFARGALGLAQRGTESHADPDFAALLAQMQTLGFAALCADEAAGGLAQDEAALAAVLAPLCREDASAGAAVYATGAAHLALRALADPGRPLPAAIEGEWLAWPAFHDVAEREWPALDAAGRLSGRADMVLLGGLAGHVVLPVRNGDEGLVLALIKLKAPGVHCGDAVRTLGLAACRIVDVTFEATTVDWRSGPLATELAPLQERLAVPALAMLQGVMAGSTATARAYAAERYQGGGPIRDWGEVRRLLALMQQHLQVATALLQREAEADGGRDGASARLALLHVAGLARQLTTDGIQLLGGNGYMKDYGQEKRLRDAGMLQSLGGSIAWRRQQLAAV